MRVTVEYFGPAREAAGVASEVIDVTMWHDAPRRDGFPAADGNLEGENHDAERRATFTVQALIRRLAHERGGRLATLLLSDGELSRSLVLAVNDQQVTTSETTDLRDGDVVTIIPPVSGGA